MFWHSHPRTLSHAVPALAVLPLLLLLLVHATPARAGASQPDPAEEQARSGSAALFSEQGYRIDRYRSPTPETARGATTVSTTALQTLIEQTPDLLILDVINLDFRHGRFLQSEPHAALPGAYWLPNTGQGELAPRWQRYLLDTTARLADNRKDRPIVVSCKSDCWLSWNVVQRLSRAGYSHLYWYRNGIDTWRSHDLPTQAIEPEAPGFAIQSGATD